MHAIERVQPGKFRGGHREAGETLDSAARRELYEETGAIRFDLRPVGLYSVTQTDAEQTFGALYTAEIQELGRLPGFEIAEIRGFSEMPPNMTFPKIQPRLVQWFELHGSDKKGSEVEK